MNTDMIELLQFIIGVGLLLGSIIAILFACSIMEKGDHLDVGVPLFVFGVIAMVSGAHAIAQLISLTDTAPTYNDLKATIQALRTLAPR